MRCRLRTMGGHPNPAAPQANSLPHASEHRLALHDRPNGIQLPDWFVASCLLRAVAELGPAPARHAYEEWRRTQGGSDTERMPASAAVITNRFGGWQAALDAAWTVCERTDATRQLVWHLQDRRDQDR